jgi:hypothetical protein
MTSVASEGMKIFACGGDRYVVRTAKIIRPLFFCSRYATHRQNIGKEGKAIDNQASMMHVMLWVTADPECTAAHLFISMSKVMRVRLKVEDRYFSPVSTRSKPGGTKSSVHPNHIRWVRLAIPAIEQMFRRFSGR